MPSVYVDGNGKVLTLNGSALKVNAGIVVDATFGNNDWATISQVSEIIASQNMSATDIYNTYGWSVGDKKSITLSTDEVIEVQIIGFNHDTLSSDHTSKAGITLQMVNCLATKYAMNSSNTNAGGWNGSVMRTSTLPTIKALLPSDLQSVIKLVDKKAANGGELNYSATVTSSDDLFLLAEIEIFGRNYGAQDGSNEGNQYSYWQSHNQDSYRIKRVNGSPVRWWERSSSNSYSSAFCLVDEYGGINKINIASYTLGVAFAFCV